jgi:hypothetical protein
MNLWRLLNQLLLILPLLASLTSAAFSQATVVGDNCNLAVLGATDTKSFFAFDSELRSALSTQDGGAMALLVKFPLRINDGRGSYYLNDAASLQARFQDVFPSPIRDAVLKQGRETIHCNYRGIMYGDGIVWVNPTQKYYAIETINLPVGNEPSDAEKDHRIKFACETAKYRVIVDAGNGDAPRYRAWTKPHSMRQKPGAEIAKGEETIEGTGSCTHHIWTFNSNQTTLVLAEVGCYPDSNQPPKGAKARLEISIPDKPKSSSWCF